jgi:hypothetical protein
MHPHAQKGSKQSTAEEPTTAVERPTMVQECKVFWDL